MAHPPPASKRVLMVAHALPRPDRARLWRWTEAARTLGELSLLAPAGPHPHLEHWRVVSARAAQLSLEPGTPRFRAARYRRRARAWGLEGAFDVVICTSPRMIRAIETRRIPMRVVDTAGPGPERPPLSGALARIRADPGVPGGWRSVSPGDDPLGFVRRLLPPRALAA